MASPRSIFPSSSGPVSSAGSVSSVQPTPPPSRVTELHYGFCSSEDILHHSVMPCRRSDTHVPSTKATRQQQKVDRMSIASVEDAKAAYGLRDLKLGVCNRHDTCQTCGEKLEMCVGHAGHIPLTLPVFHPGLFNAMLRVLRTICKTCSAVLLPDSLKHLWDVKVRKAQQAGDIYRITALSKEIVTEAAKCRNCPRCGAVNGIVRNVRPFRVVHFKYDGVNAPAAATGVTPRSSSAGGGGAGGKRGGNRGGNKNDGGDEALAGGTNASYLLGVSTEIKTGNELYRDCFATASLLNEQLANTRAQLVEFLDPVRVRQLLANVRPADVTLFGMEPGVSLPDLVTTTLPVVPMCTRPSGLNTAGPSTPGNEIRDDDITRLYFEVQSVNDALRSAQAAQGSTSGSVVNWWNELQFRFVRLMDAGLPGYLPAQRMQQPMKGFAQRLKGKHGRFRGNLSGKRVDFSGRSVISPDPNLEIDEVAIPLRMAKSLTYPQKVFAHNLSLMKKLVINGPDTHPGALIARVQGDPKDLRFVDRVATAQKLQVGDVVERHCISGDYVIFNRQPSLHRLSMMTHRARVLPHRTLRFNECCCAPYNADFDGDEMNIHLVQTEDARAEAHTLMSTVRNIISAKNGEPIIACTQDFLTGSFLLSSMDTFLDRAQVSQLVAYWGNASGLARNVEDFDLPPPAIRKPRELWTGKQVFDLMICPRFDKTKANSVERSRSIEMNLEAAAGQYSKGARSLCQNEGWVTFHRGHLVTGRLDKKLLGGGAKDGLFAQLNVVTGTELAARVMGRIARGTSRWLQNRGFSLGLGDVATTNAVHERKQAVVANAFAQCRELIRNAQLGRLQSRPGMTMAETLESRLNAVLSEVRQVCGTEAVKVLDRSNAPLVMAQSGSKGSTLNIAQMMACVGQQTVSGSRIKPSFFHRTLPHVPRFAEDPAARGFVVSSFFNGLTPTEFFFHTMAGREGLVDTAVKTADTGYIQRRVMKACEDLSVHYDWTVRNAKKNVVQAVYGEDGLDPLLMEGSNNAPVNFHAMWKNLVNAAEAEVIGFPRNDAAGAAAAADDNNTNNGSAAGSRLGESSTELRLLVNTLVDQLMSRRGGFTSRFSEDARGFASGLVQKYEEMRARLGVDAPGLSRSERLKRFVCCLNMAPCSSALLREFLHRCARKFRSKRMEPGTPCGALAAQSLCEPATQMTLRTFHFAGVASMSVTMGVPRLKEIINASKSIKTPVVRAPLRHAHDRMAANLVKATVERITLRDVALRVTQVISPGKVLLRFVLHEALIQKMQVASTLNAASVRLKILEYARRPLSPLRELRDHHIELEGRHTFTVRAPREDSGQDVYFLMQSMRAVLLDIFVHGIDSAKFVMVVKDEEKSNGSSANNDDDDKKKKQPSTYTLLAETSEFLRVMSHPVVDGLRTTCNHVDAVATTLGIEAARALIVSEIKDVLSAYSMSVDVRHIQLIADVMTHRGVVLGIQNYGIQKMNSGVLTMASFERTTDHLYNACVFQRSDKALSVSESIIVGAPIPLGTNSFGLLLNYSGKENNNNNNNNNNNSVEEKQQATNNTKLKDGNAPTAAAASKKDNINNAMLGSSIGAGGGTGPNFAFRSIFERSPLTASMNVSSSISFAADLHHERVGADGAGGRKRKEPEVRGQGELSPRRRLYSMERAKSGSQGLDL